MYREFTVEERMHRSTLRLCDIELQSIEAKCFRLECRMDRFERDWPGSTSSKQRDLRLERLRIIHECEMLKIDIEAFERRLQPFLEPPRL
jgi:hypothetical protein